MALQQKSFCAGSADPEIATQSGSQWLQTENSLFGHWSDLVKQTFGRQMEALMKDQEERAFLATGHGSLYTAPSYVTYKD